MRVNIYAEELLNMVTPVHKVADTGKVYYGIRFPLASSERLHHTEDDDDRSGVTFWFPANGSINRATLVQMFTDAGTMVNAMPRQGEGMTPLFGPIPPPDQYVIGSDNVAYGPFPPHEDRPLS